MDSDLTCVRASPKENMLIEVLLLHVFTIGSVNISTQHASTGMLPLPKKVRVGHPAGRRRRICHVRLPELVGGACFYERQSTSQNWQEMLQNSNLTDF